VREAVETEEEKMPTRIMMGEDGNDFLFEITGGNATVGPDRIDLSLASGVLHGPIVNPVKSKPAETAVSKGKSSETAIHADSSDYELNVDCFSAEDGCDRFGVDDYNLQGKGVARMPSNVTAIKKEETKLKSTRAQKPAAPKAKSMRTLSDAFDTSDDDDDDSGDGSDVSFCIVKSETQEPFQTNLVIVSEPPFVAFQYDMTKGKIRLSGGSGNFHCFDNLTFVARNSGGQGRQTRLSLHPGRVPAELRVLLRT
jgi:hypothetical protein